VSFEPPNPLKFHAAGTAFSASFKRPVAYEVPTQAAVYLPTIGGHGYSNVENFDAPRLVKFGSASSHVSGSFENPTTAASEVTTSISGLNILNMIKADRITARLSSEHKLNEEAHILALGSFFENLHIGGYEFKIKLRHEIFINNKTHAELVKNVASPKENGKIAAAQDKVKLCTLVEEIVTDFPGLSGDDKKKHVIKIPQFGTITFAEVLCWPGTKILTMLRFDLGCPDVATGLAAEAVLNGPQYPPPHK
jgi:hypothetical protein